jgi:MFS family permease
MRTARMDREVFPVAPLPGEIPVGNRVLAWLKDRTFRSLKHRDYRLYFFGQLISFTGGWMQSAALMWLVYDLTHDPLWPPMMLVAQVGPTLLLGTWGGSLADRIPKRKLIMFTQSSFLGTALIYALLTMTGFASPWLLLAVQVLNGVIQSADLPGRMSFVPDLVPRHDLINAVSLNALLFNSARAVGPAMAGGAFLLADAVVEAGWFTDAGPTIVGAAGSFLFNAATYLVVLYALWRIHATGASPPRQEAASMWEGFRLVAASAKMRGLLLISGILCVFAWPALTLFPAYTRTVLLRTEKEYSLLVSALGLGALIAALTSASFGSAAMRGRFLILGAVMTSLGLLGLQQSTQLAWALVSTATLGFGLILYLSTGQSTMQLESTVETRGRMMALWAMMLSASAPLGHLLAGVAAQSVPIPQVFLVLFIGVGLGTVALIPFVGRHLSR